MARRLFDVPPQEIQLGRRKPMTSEDRSNPLRHDQQEALRSTPEKRALHTQEAMVSAAQPLNASSTPTSDTAVIGKLVREELDRNNKYLEFAQGQIEKDRSFYKHLYTYAIAFIGCLIVVAGFFSYNSVNQMRTDMKTLVDAELATLRATINQELANVRTEVQKRIDTEFRSDNIARLIASAAKERTDNELTGIIRSETSAQVAKGIQEQGPAIQKIVEDQTREAVKTLQPIISRIVTDELEAQVKKSVTPVEAKMKVYEELVTTQRLSALAKNGDRKSFDQLLAIGLMGVTSLSEETKMLAQTTVRDIIRQKHNILRRMKVDFKEKQSPEAMKIILKNSPHIDDRLAAIDNFPQDDVSILPLLIETIQSDNDLEVVWTAFRLFNSMTKQSFEFPNYGQVFEWWNKNRATFDQNQIYK
jgi:hypothetical protein